MPKCHQDEDDSVFDDTDEVYVEADFVDGDGGVRLAFTNPVSGTFSAGRDTTLSGARESGRPGRLTRTGTDSNARERPLPHCR